jgi:thymidylate synthase (FAD)
MANLNSARLYVVARPALDEAEIARFLDDEGTEWRRTSSAQQAEELIELAGRLCYFSFGKRQSPRDASAYIRRLVDAGHHSVLEHAAWSFVLTGVSRGFSHQMVRHRIGFSYSQLSQQYHDEREALAVVPPAIEGNPELVVTWHEAVEQARMAYRTLLDTMERATQEPLRGEQLRLVRTAARSVLPAATETKICFTANARAIRHFLAERGNLEGDEEMRVVSALLFRAMKREAPLLVPDFEERTGTDALPLVVQVPIP